MKLLRTILATTLVLWAMEFLCYTILFAGWLVRFVMQWFAAFGSPQPETSFESFLQMVMKTLAFPVRLFFANQQVEAGTFGLILQFAIGGVIWGIFLGAAIHEVRELQRRANAA